MAELLTRAQSARIGLTEADLYPQFFLFGSVGFSETVESGDRFSASDALTASIGPGLSWNIFNYGRLKNNVRAQDAVFQQTLVNYQNTVLRAYQEAFQGSGDMMLLQPDSEFFRYLKDSKGGR